MPLSNASRLADFGTGIGTAGAIIQVDNVNQRLGVGTTAPTATLGVAGIVSATAFYGDGSNLDGVASAGLGTALSEEEFNPLTVIYQTSDTLSVGATITVDPPDATTKVAYTQYSDIKLEGDADLIIADGDDFIPDILGLSTEGFSFSNANGNGIFDTVYTDNIENAAGRGAPNFPLGITVTGISTLSGNVSIGGTLTYEDVTNVDSIGVVTARNGIKVTTGGIDITAGGLDITAGGVTVTAGGANIAGNIINSGGELRLKNASGDSNGLKLYQGSGDTSYILNHYSGPLVFGTVNTERLRIGSAGQIGLGGANYGTSGQVLTSQGASAAPQWASAAGVPTKIAEGTVANNTTISECGTNIFSSTYQFYTIKYWINANGSGPHLGLQVYSNGGWQTSSNTYYFQEVWGKGGNSYASNGSGNNLMINESGDGGDRTGARGEVHLYDTQASTYKKLITGLNYYYDTTNTGMDISAGQFAGGLHNGGDYPITGIRFMTSSNQFTGGKWIVYGYN